jgi:hypothetical protein
MVTIGLVSVTVRFLSSRQKIEDYEMNSEKYSCN